MLKRRLSKTLQKKSRHIRWKDFFGANYITKICADKKNSRRNDGKKFLSIKQRDVASGWRV